MLVAPPRPYTSPASLAGRTYTLNNLHSGSIRNGRQLDLLRNLLLIH